MSDDCAPGAAPESGGVEAASLPEVSFREAVRVWGRIAASSFGGPAGQIAVMQRILVDEKRWLSQERFLHALNYCMLLPGPEAQQLVTYTGWLLHRTAGGLVAGLLFVLPGFASILALSIVYVELGSTALVAGLFYGLKPAVLAIVIQAFLRLGQRALGTPARWSLALAAFLALFVFDIAFPWVVLVAALVGWSGGRLRHRDREPVTSRPGRADAGPEPPALRRTLRVLAIWLTVWWLPVGGLALFLGARSTFTQEAVFFSQAAVVTFGGAYAVLSYIAQRAVEDFGWLAPGEMLDGLGLAETTPGPLVQVVQFVGFLGAYRHPGDLEPLVAGVLGSIVVTWVTFAPCFLWIFLGAPYIEWLRGHRGLSDALSAVTAAIVGVLLNLATWFALHTLFRDVRETSGLWFKSHVPVLGSLDPGALVLVGLCVFLLFARRWSLLKTLSAGALGGLAWSSLV